MTTNVPAAGTAGRSALPEEITGPRVIAIARGLPGEQVERIAEGLLAGGVRAFEITLNSDGAIRAIQAVAAALGNQMLVGAGTVLSVEGAAAAVDAGARFLVSPHTEPDVIEWAVSREIPIFPGAFTPTEILLAWRSGATAVKLFPASTVGSAFVREFRGPFREIPLIPTGGVTIDSAPAFITAGAVAVGLGSWLTGDGEPAGIAERGARLVEVLRTAG